jgi:hypothetical protein
MEPEGEVIDLHVHRRDKYALKCGERRLSYRALKLVVFILMSALLLTIVIVRALRQKKSGFETLAEVVVTAFALITPSF